MNLVVLRADAFELSFMCVAFLIVGMIGLLFMAHVISVSR